MIHSVIGVKSQQLENERIIPLPFEPPTHTTKFLEVMKCNSDLFKYVSFPPMDTHADFMNEFYNKQIAASSQNQLYAIIDKTILPANDNPNNYAGMASVSRIGSSITATADIGIVGYPPFLQTHVASNTVGVLLLWLLEPSSHGGLGLRRVEWQTHSGNARSRQLAERMGFELEGIMRWKGLVTGEGKIVESVEGLEKRNGTEGEAAGRHTALYSIVWDEWEEKRATVFSQMKRKI